MKTVYKMSRNQVCRKTFSEKKNLNVHVDHNVIGVYHEVRNETIINIEERGSLYSFIRIPGDKT